MKIATWNCNGALRNKFDALMELNADLYIIQECENPAESKEKQYRNWANNHLWIGDTKNKGIGIFASKNIHLKFLNWPETYKNHSVKHFLPCSVNDEFNILGVWTHYNNSPTFGYIGQFWRYLQVNKDRLNNTVIAGDFNSNVKWDKLNRWWNHSDVVKELNEIGIESLYHKYTREKQGEETMPTLFLHRKIERPYHIDYLFAPKQFLNCLTNVEVGLREKWLQISDHLPLICEFNTSQLNSQADSV